MSVQSVRSGDGTIIAFDRYGEGPPVILSRGERVAPTLVIDGGDSPGWIREAADAVAEALPDARRRTLDGLTHDVDPDVLVPVLDGFFGGDGSPETPRGTVEG